MGYLCCRKDKNFEGMRELRQCQKAMDTTQTFEKIKLSMWYPIF